MEKIKTAPVDFTLTLLLAVVFIASAVPKMIHPVDFAVNLNNYRLFPQTLIPWLAVWFPWFELVLGTFLLFGVFRRETLVVTSVIYIIFIFVIAWALYQGLDISCGCFGQDPAETSSLGLRLAEDFILWVAALWLLIRADA